MCTQQAGAGGVNQCYGNGVKVVATFQISAMPTASARVLRPDGSLCYAVDLAVTPGGDIIYKDGAGAILAKGVSSRGGLLITCPGSSPVMVPNNCSLVGSTQERCRTGACM
jgi:hypothetical protein